MAFGQKQQGSKSAAIERINFSPTWALMSKNSQFSRIKQIISVAYVSPNSDLSSTG